MSSRVSQDGNNSFWSLFCCCSTTEQDERQRYGEYSPLLRAGDPPHSRRSPPPQATGAVTPIGTPEAKGVLQRHDGTTAEASPLKQNDPNARKVRAALGDRFEQAEDS